MGFTWNFLGVHEMFIGFSRNCDGKCIGMLMGFHGIVMHMSWDLHRNFIEMSWNAHGISWEVMANLNRHSDGNLIYIPINWLMSNHLMFIFEHK